MKSESRTQPLENMQEPGLKGRGLAAEVDWLERCVQSACARLKQVVYTRCNELKYLQSLQEELIQVVTQQQSLLPFTAHGKSDSVTPLDRSLEQRCLAIKRTAHASLETIKAMLNGPSQTEPRRPCRMFLAEYM